MNDREYEAMNGIRRSDLWWINKTPAHFLWHMDNKEEQTPALLFGSAAHKYVLERDDFFTEYAVVPQVDRRTKIGKETIDVFKREHQKQSWIDEEDFVMIQQMRDALFANAEIKQILTAEHRTEVPFIWVDDESANAKPTSLLNWMVCRQSLTIRPHCLVKMDRLKDHHGNSVMTSSADSTWKASTNALWKNTSLHSSHKRRPHHIWHGYMSVMKDSSTRASASSMNC